MTEVQGTRAGCDACSPLGVLVFSPYAQQNKPSPCTYDHCNEVAVITPVALLWIDTETKEAHLKWEVYRRAGKESTRRIDQQVTCTCMCCAGRGTDGSVRTSFLTLRVTWWPGTRPGRSRCSRRPRRPRRLSERGTEKHKLSTKF